MNPQSAEAEGEEPRSPDEDRSAADPARWARPGLVTIRCREDGPYVIELPVEPPGAGAAAAPGIRVIDHEGVEFALPTGKRALALCRCGRSAKRPFCDGSHRDVGFSAGERAAPS
jgi:CDGSH-type Zn-finger protein